MNKYRAIVLAAAIGFGVLVLAAPFSVRAAQYELTGTTNPNDTWAYELFAGGKAAFYFDTTSSIAISSFTLRCANFYGGHEAFKVYPASSAGYRGAPDDTGTPVIDTIIPCHSTDPVDTQTDPFPTTVLQGTYFYTLQHIDGPYASSYVKGNAPAAVGIATTSSAWIYGNPGHGWYHYGGAGCGLYDSAPGATWNIIGYSACPGGAWDNVYAINYSDGQTANYLVANGTSTPPTPVGLEPVIIVPGIMGTRLNRAVDGEEVWPNTKKMGDVLDLSDSYLDDLILTNNGVQYNGKEMNTSQVLDSAFGVSVYQNLLQKFIDSGYTTSTLFTFPYDWRFDLTTQISRLNSVIQQAIAQSPTGKINIVAHSIGGLLVRAYLTQSTSTNFLNNLVFAGTPQTGAPKAFKALTYGDNMGFVFGPFDILNPDEIKKISQNMATAYELLPSRRYVDINGGYIKDFRNGAKILTYDESTQFMLQNPADSRNPLLLETANIFHSNLDQFIPTADHIYNIVGCRNFTTIGGIRMYPNGKYDIDSANGDGTVPIQSAMNNSSGFINYFVNYEKTAIDHMGLVSEPRTVDLISNLVNSQSLSSFVLPLGISTSTSECFTPLFPNTILTYLFSTHSPVALHVYDATGHHVGPLPNGDIELGIPGSSYESLGENHFAFVPAGGTYRVYVQGLSSGTFDLKARTLTGSDVVSEATYLSIPLESSSTNATLNFSGTSGDLTLNVDKNGDGITDTTTTPSAILSASQSSDITPPTIASVIPSTVIVNSSIALNFSATDDLSGVAILRATLDGLPVISLSSIVIGSAGVHQLNIEAVDRAGNLSTKDVMFNAVYQFGGFLPPIKADGSGIYKLGSTLPIKFQLTNATGTFVTNAIARLTFSKISNGIMGTTTVALATSVANSGDQFRYDATSNSYIFNLSTKPMSTGEWQLRATLDDQKVYTVNVALK